MKNSSPGHDDIHIKIIKHTITLLAPRISELVNDSFQCGIFPDDMKLAKIIPIYKGGNKLLITNYRPISILPTISKIMERVMYDRLILFLEVNRILKDNQFGFRKNYSPQLALIKFINHILQQHDRGNFTVCVFLDLRKAFDTINHDILIKKLEHYGIRNQTLNWFVSYLSGRQQY